MRFQPAKAISVSCVVLVCSLLPNCGGGGSANRTPTLNQILVAPASKSIPKGTALTLTATGIYSDGTKKDLTGSVTWQASPASVATITAQGSLAGIGLGVAKVLAASQGLTGNASITVGAPALAQIAVSAPESSLPQGETEALTAIGTYTDGSTQNLTASATWQAGPSNVATVSAQGSLKGLNAGVAQVSAAYHGVTGNASVTVGTAALVSIAVTAPKSALPLGESEALTAIGSFSNGTTQNLTQQVAWKTNPVTVAAVDVHGNLSGLAQGITQVSAAYQSVTGTAPVSVGSAALLRLDISPSQSSVPLGESETLVATGTFSDGTVQNLTHVAVWSSSQSAIASVSTIGAVAGKTLGTATITSAVGSVSGTAGLTVTAPVIVGVSVNPAQWSLIIGANGVLQALATFSDGSTQDVTATATWSSEEPTIVAASPAGAVLAEQVGTAIIQAEQGGFTGNATLTVAPMVLVSYFNRRNAANSNFDGTIRLVNPGFTQGDMCAMIYVFDANQEMNACCGCVISDSGLLTLSLLKDVTANPLTGGPPAVGSIDIVPSNLGANNQCNAGSPTPNSMLAGWETNVQPPSGAYQVTEIPYSPVALLPTEEQVLAEECGMIQTLGSGTGICTCGTGD
jgi:Bacterial Ig-like domain (group 2)